LALRKFRVRNAQVVVKHGSEKVSGRYWVWQYLAALMGRMLNVPTIMSAIKSRKHNRWENRKASVCPPIVLKMDLWRETEQAISL